MTSWKGTLAPRATGGWPRRPAATCAFCSRMARDHVVGRHLQGGQPPRIEPDSHAVVARAEENDVAHAVQPRQRILHLQRGEVAQVELVVGEAAVLVLLRDEVDAEEDAGRFLLRRHARPPHFVRQLRLGDGDPVLHEDLGHVQVGPQLERRVKEHLPVVRRARRHVDHPLDAVDLLLDGRGHGRGDGLRVGPGIDGADLDRRRRDIRVLGHRQLDQSDQPDQHDRQREHRGEDRAIDEERANMENSSL